MKEHRSRRRGLVESAVVAAVLSLGCPSGVSARSTSAGRALPGLPRWKAHDVHLDEHGFLWVGMLGGLARHDGARAQLFTRRDGLSHDVVRRVTQDARGTTWVGTYAGGACRLAGDRFECFGAEEGLPSPLVEDVLADSAGRVWVATRAGVSRFDGLRFERVRHDRLEASVYDMHEDDQGRIWFAGEAGLTCLAPDGHSACSDLPPWFDMVEPAPVYRSLVDGRGWLWLSRGARLTVLPERRVTERYRELAGLAGVSSLSRGADGAVWVTTNGAGALHFDGRRWKRLGSGKLTGENAVNALVEDGEGTTWLATDAGMSAWSESVRAVTTADGLPEDAVWALAEEPSGAVWLGTDGGACRIDGAGMSCLTEGLPDRRVRSLLVDREGRTWIGTRGEGIARWDGERLEVLGRDTLVRAPYALLQDQSDRIWIGTNGRGLFTWHDGTWSRVPLTADGSRTPVFALHEDRSGAIWIGTYGEGLLRWNGDEIEHWTTGSGLCGQVIMSLAEDRGGDLWIGTMDGGACRFDGEQFQTLAPTAWHGSSTVYATLVDSDDRLWLGTSGGIDWIDLKQLDERGWPAFERPGRGGAGVSEVNHAASLETSDGALWFGTIDGAVRFERSVTDPLPPPAPPVLTDVRLAHEAVDWSTRGPTAGVGRVPLMPRLAPSEDHVTIGFVAPALAAAEHVRYRYRIRDDEHGWSPPVPERHATYARLAPGAYRFEVQASRNGVDWSAPTPFEFSVAAPPWRQPWLLILTGLAGMTGLSLFVHWRVKRVRSREERKTRRSRLLAEARLTALRAQLNPHFVFNSLNSIQQLVLAQEGSQAVQYLGRFARLLRSILARSEHKFVPLEDELEFLRLYLDLEALRFDDRFAFELQVDPHLDTGHVAIPPLLIQPYVENAIRHGLRHAEGMRQLTISLTQHPEGLLCVVDDDGVGRARARQLTAGRADDGGPSGTGVSEERLSLLAAQGIGPGRVTIIDKERGGAATGTRVELVLPVASLSGEPT